MNWEIKMTFYQRMMREILLKYILIAIVLIVTSCSSENRSEQDEVILARIGDVTISVGEFEQRAEHAIRPTYCNGDNNLHKKIILNSLIAEKIFAIETGETNELVQNKQFQSYILGRQEQAMREWLLHEEGFQKVNLEDSEIQREYANSGKTYKVQYFQIPNDSLAAVLKEQNLDDEGAFEVLYQQSWQGAEVPEKEVAWKAQEHPQIHKAMFGSNNTITKGTVIGPIKINNNNHIVMKVLGWTNKPVITESERIQRLDEVKEKLTEMKAIQHYDKYVVSIMEGKKLDFDRKTFNSIVKLIGPFYMQTPEEKRELFLNATFDREEENPELSNLAKGIDRISNNSFFRVDDQVWTVKDFKHEIQRHPLVFRKNLPKDTKFAEHLRYAIIDMIRDKFLTEEAYKRNYQDVDAVKRNREMWRDALIARYEMGQYIKNTVPNYSDSLNTLNVIQDYLNPYIDELQKKYDNQVEVNIEQFDKIKLTRIDMIVMQRNVPFPIVVPEFPQLTTDSKLDYGKRMK